MGGINANVLARRFSEIEAGSGGAATWDERAVYSRRLSGSAVLRTRGCVAPIIDGIQQYCRQTKQKYRRLGKLQAATADFGLKQGFNLELI
jgi:hypothetical protein